MTLQELTEQVFKGKDVKTQLIGIYEGPGKTICPDYADEYLETHGDRGVGAYQYKETANLLIVQLQEGN